MIPVALEVVEGISRLESPMGTSIEISLPVMYGTTRCVWKLSQPKDSVLEATGHDSEPVNPLESRGPCRDTYYFEPKKPGSTKLQFSYQSIDKEKKVKTKRIHTVLVLIRGDRG